MARIVVMSMAYRGDVHPYVPVATELAARGHEVTFVVPREFHSELSAEPFDLVHSGSDFSPSELNQHGAWLARWGMRLGGARLLELYFGKFTVPFLEAQYQAIFDALEGADALFCHSTAGIVGAMAAEAHQIPWISGDLFPMLIPTATTSFIPTAPSMGPTLNRLGWRIARSPRPVRLTYAKDFADFRRSKGLDHTLRSPIDLRISPNLNLGMASPSYLPAAPDWPANYHMTGFTHWENDAGEMPDGLDDFLDAGDPPVLVTLGTLAAASHPERFPAAVEAIDRVGHRTISLCSLSETAAGINARFPAAQHRAWTFAPLQRVLPRVRAVVHSGAHGTNSMTLAAGKPSLVMPSIFDQVWHAKRQVELGTGVKVRKPKQLDSAVRRLVSDSSLAETAEALGEVLRGEPCGSETAADAIEAYLAR